MNTHTLNHNFLSSAKAEIWKLTVCIVVNGEIDLNWTMPNARTHTHTQTHTHTHTHTHIHTCLHTHTHTH